MKVMNWLVEDRIPFHHHFRRQVMKVMNCRMTGFGSHLRTGSFVYP